MDVQTFAAVMGNTLPAARYHALLPAWNRALIQAQCTTVNRVAMWCAQVGHESVGLKYMSEIWGPTAAQRSYEGRASLGNTQAGDGKRFMGHGPIQITGRANHAAVSRWAYAEGYVPTLTYFVDNPTELGADRYGFLGVVWYWTVARTRMNTYADAGDVLAATRAVNGGTNGLADRAARWERALTFGTRLLPTGPDGDDDMTPEQAQKLEDIHNALTTLLKPWPGGVSDKEPTKLEDPAVAGYSVVQYLLRNNVEIHQLRNEVASLAARLNAKP